MRSCISTMLSRNSLKIRRWTGDVVWNNTYRSHGPVWSRLARITQPWVLCYSCLKPLARSYNPHVHTSTRHTLKSCKMAAIGDRSKAQPRTLHQSHHVLCPQCKEPLHQCTYTHAAHLLPARHRLPCNCRYAMNFPPHAPPTLFFLHSSEAEGPFASRRC